MARRKATLAMMMAGIVEEDDVHPPWPFRGGGGPKVLTADPARQGPRGGRVLIIPVCGMVAIAVAFGLMWRAMPGAP